MNSPTSDRDVEAPTPIGLRINLESLEEPSPIWGGIWIEKDGTCFPEHNWNDIVMGVLRSMLESTAELHEGATSSSATFMDGPFALQFSTRPEALVYIESVDRHDDPDPRPEKIEGEVTLASWTESLVATAHDLLSELERRHWTHDTDYAGLRSDLARLERARRNQR